MIRKDEIEIEVKREMVCLLLNTSHFSFQKIDQVIDCAYKLSCFVVGGNQAPCQPEKVIESIIQDLDSQGPLARALEKWLVRNERLRATFRGNRQRAPTSPLAPDASEGLHQDHHPKKC